MNLTYWNWLITGLEGMVSMFAMLMKDRPSLTAEMHRRLSDCAARLISVVDNSNDLVENR